MAAKIFALFMSYLFLKLSSPLQILSDFSFFFFFFVCLAQRKIEGKYPHVIGDLALEGPFGQRLYFLSLIFLNLENRK